MWCWPGGLVKHHPGRVTSACQNVSKSQEMAVNPPTHRSFTCYNLLEPACPSPLTLRSTNSALNILTAHDFQHRGIGCSVWLPKMWTPSAPHNSDATFFLAIDLVLTEVNLESVRLLSPSPVAHCDAQYHRWQIRPLPIAEYRRIQQSNMESTCGMEGYLNISLTSTSVNAAC